MIVISLLAQKGGAGKTTISVNLAAALAVLHPSLSVAVGDCDKQGSSSAWINRGKGAAGITVHAVGQDNDGKNLKAELEALGKDIVILDLPPALETVALRAAIRSDLLLIPALPSILDLNATTGALELAREALDINPDKKYLIIPNRVQNNTACGRELRGILEAWGPVSKATICQRVAYSEAAILGIGVIQSMPSDHPAHQEIRLLAEEVSKLLNI